jgi:predicted fused transcriptional regulator/phosphomethylpyrimidine kinase
MVAKVLVGEDMTMSETPADLAAVKQRLEEIQRRKRGRVRWSISKHTAELALGALAPGPERQDRCSKSRRRKRYKRLL